MGAKELSSAMKLVQDGEALYQERNRLAHKAYLLPLRDIRRLNDLIARLTPADLKMVAAYAEGLAEWHDAAQPSGDATIEGSSAGG